MIFTSTYKGEVHELFRKNKFKGVKVSNNRVPFVWRSLTLLYEMYFKWVNSKQGFYMIPIELIIPEGLCSETILDDLFYTIQHEVAWRMPRGDKSVGLVWTTEIANNTCVHRGYLFIKTDAFEYARDHKGYNCFFDFEFNEVINGCVDSITERYSQGVVGSTGFPRGEGSELLVFYPNRGDGDRNIQDNFKVLSRLAQVKVKDGYSAPLFRVRYGFNPRHKREPFEWTRPFDISPEDGFWWEQEDYVQEKMALAIRDKELILREKELALKATKQ